jgi:hypothetical protein
MCFTKILTGKSKHLESGIFVRLPLNFNFDDRNFYI